MNSEGLMGCGTDDGYDAVVVGSGYGGSVAACRLSMAGVKVCLLEKGRRWEAQDFPTDSFKIMSAARIENRPLGLSFGPKDALFRVYKQEDSLAAMACGLGGGSLVNAGVMLSTPVRARRNPKWPKEWERDWEIYEASALSMLRAQSIPTKFKNAKIMEKVLGGEYEETSQDPLKLSINFAPKEQKSNFGKSWGIDSCLACGNCLAGCPYNAKISTDKTYLISAVEAGCTIRTECQVRFIVRNKEEDDNDKIIGGKRRRWLVFLNGIDYITTDFVILAAGVFGTTDILFQSQMRGLNVSEKLGSGLSCNGNNVAYLAGSSTPLNAYGLNRNQFPNIHIPDRPGPSISSSYTSSLGFTIQSAVLPTAYPCFLFKCIETYGCPSNYSIIKATIDKLKHVFGLRHGQDMILNAMGYDDSDGKISFDKETNRILFKPPNDPLLHRKIEAFQKLAKKLGGTLFMSKYRSTAVHLLGGCNASSDDSGGVCNSRGQVFYGKSPKSVHPGLYVCDSSIVPCSVGLNPCLTIATIAENISRKLVGDVIEYKISKGLVTLSENWGTKQGLITSWKVENGLRNVVVCREKMEGHVGGMSCSAHLKLKLNCGNLAGFDEKRVDFGEDNPLLRGKVGGYVVFRALEMDRLHVIEGEVGLCEVDVRTPYTQYMIYRLLLVSASGSRYILEGKKVMNPYLLGLYAWRESTTMHVSFRRISQESINLKGELRISAFELIKSTFSLGGAKRERFLCLLLQSLLRTYVLQVPRVIQKGFNSSEFKQNLSYPKDTLHKIKTDDGFIISCRQWKSSRLEEDRELNPILLINGYSTESYWLPSEPNDLIRTLLQEGYETWLLQPRFHPLNPSNRFTIEDIGRIDIPAAIGKMIEVRGESIRVHVIAHCVGGLAIHMAIMGGHVSASRIASLSCTNSSMFFELNASSRFKMWLPLIPISMAILGNNMSLPLHQTLKSNFRQKLLKSIARLMPRHERCTLDECEVFSGIFGNTFWHENVSQTMHYHLNKQTLPSLPMAAFPHLRKIVNAGFIVDGSGKNSFLIHPERMTLPTLYISGGRTLLVSRRTSFLANKYMKMHQPKFRHERVCLDGFGHSDLLIGEEACGKVFPHILSHIGLAEKGGGCGCEGGGGGGGGEGKKWRCNSQEALDWCDDPYGEEAKGGGAGLWIFGFLFSILLVALILRVPVWRTVWKSGFQTYI